MKIMKTIPLTLLLLVTGIGHAAQKAVTDTGEEVLLKRDGTWEYLDARRNRDIAITTIDKPFSKPAEANFQLKSKVNGSAFWLNTEKWRFGKGSNNEDAEYEFELKDGDLYAMAITEGIMIPAESLADIALETAADHAPDARITRRESREVNGNRLIYQEIDFSMHGVDFTYLGYYFADESGATQLIAYTAANLTEKYRPEIELLLNGLVSQP